MIFALLAVSAQGQTHFARYGKIGPGPTLFSVNAKADGEVGAFREDWPELQAASGRKVSVQIDPLLGKEEFQLSLGSTATVRAGSRVGLAWGLQTLGEVGARGVRQAEIREKPDFAFRAVTLDVARRFHSLSTLRQMVRWCHAGKVRFLQLHLTDDQNWMLPTPVLAGVDGSNSSGHPAYTRQEMQALQSFAAARGVAIVPEIDIPGHSSLLVKFDPAKFAIKGSASSNCINFGSAEVRKTIKALIHETAQLFSGSPYIHIGGDEAWYPDAEKDGAFSSSMKAIGADATAQSVFVDFVADMAETVLAERKTPVVWEGFGATIYAKTRIPKKTVVIAWEGQYYPAQDLVKDGFRLVNAGWDPFYVVNHYPYDAYTLVPLPTLYKLKPRTFGIVNWSPGTSGKVELPPSGDVLGSMMCWWEGYEWNAQTTLPLRILALGSRLWNQSARVDYDEFLRAGQATVNRINMPFRVAVEGSRPGNRLEFVERATVIPKAAGSSLRFAIRLDGGAPMLSDIKARLDVTSSSVVTIQAYRGSKAVGETQFLSLKKVTVVPNLALGARVSCSAPEDPQFPARLVTDGVSDNVGSFWMGYPNPCSLTVDLGRIQKVNRVDVVPFWAAGQTTEYQVEISTDAMAWNTVVSKHLPDTAPTVAGYVHRFSDQAVRFIRVRVTGSQQFPPSMARIHEVRAFYERP